MAQPTVFLSSASAGMSDLRQALRYNLTQRGFEVLAFEDGAFPITGNQQAIEECLSIVRRADYYLLIIGNDAGRVENGTSPTREEFLAARESQQNTGRPRNILTVRAATRTAIDRHRRGEPTPELSNPEFISNFIEEVETARPDLPNWLHRFADFGELMDILVTRLQLGRNREETLARKAILDEVLRNLAHTVSRRRETALPDHLWGQQAREAIELTNEMLGQSFLVDRHVANSLAGCFVATNLARLSSTSLDRAIQDGYFLEYSPEDGRYFSGEMQAALKLVSDDINRAKAVLDTTNDWRLELMSAAAEANRTGRQALVSGDDVVWALVYVDRASDLFSSQIALAKYLLTGEGSPLPDCEHRSPASPIVGAAEGLWRETVEPSEVEQLILGNISPFGIRLPGTIFSDDQLAEMAAELAEKNLPVFERMLDGMSPDARGRLGDIQQSLQSAALDVLKGLRAEPGEGITDRG